MNFKNKYNKEDFLNFFQEKFLPSDFHIEDQKLSFDFKPNHIKDVNLIGRVDSLELNVYEAKHNSEYDPRVSLSKDIFRIMRDYSVKRALILFVSDNSENYRLSLATINFNLEDTKVRKEYSNPRRYSFFLGPDAKTHTPEEFLVKKERVKDFEDLQKRFSVEVVNKEFYSEIAKKFTELVGGERKIKSKVEKFKSLMQLPSTDDHQKMQEFVVRMIGRIVFSWFLKKKKSQNGIPLIPENILSRDAVKKNKDYYHSVLEKLFFEVMNKKKEERINYRNYELYENIPFLNGGLFEPHNDDYYNGKPLFNLVIPDKWLEEFFQILETYNFTIDENTSVDIDLSVDPEMLGRIFENLLAEINPETGETARKSTGSYYTPRPIVDYMVDESLKQFLIGQLNLSLGGGVENEFDKKLSVLLDYSISENPFNETESKKILDALNEIKILDPACGSGAFPIGILQKMLLILQKIDRNSEMWLEKKIERIDNSLLKKEMKSKFKNENLDYIRKLGIIQDSIYGVDIQSIAVEISKLRCFLTLIVDESIDDKKENRGIVPLPNLEFKFVAANTLIALPEAESTLFDESEYMNKLEELRDDYFTSSGKDKVKIEKEFRQTQEKMARNLLQNKITSGRAIELANWNPFSYESAKWFDPKWMFGLKEGFDIVIGNPPYGIEFDSKQIKFFKSKYISANTIKNKLKGSLDSFSLFIEFGLFHSCSNVCVLTYIIPMSFTSSDSMSSLHQLLLNHCEILFVSSYFDRPKKIFDNAEQPVSILIANKNNNPTKQLLTTKVVKRYSDVSIESIITDLSFVNSLKCLKMGRIPKVGSELEISILKKLLEIENKLKNMVSETESRKKIYYRTSGGRYYKLITNFSTSSTKENYFNLKNSFSLNFVCSVLSSNLYFWFYHIYSNCRDLKASELLMFPIPYFKFNEKTIQLVEKLYLEYLLDLENNSYVKNVSYKNVKTYKEYYPRYSKNIIDKIDLSIKDAYGFTDEEINFIINYDLKFRTDDAEE